MKYIFAAENADQLTKMQNAVKGWDQKLQLYIDFLKEKYEVRNLPRCIVWTTEDIATCLISDIPLPAYTNEYRVMMAPEKDCWRRLYLRQLEHIEVQNEATAVIRDHYENLSEHQILQIIGHELAHHSELFPNDFDDDNESGIWFEEGMVEYISRKYFLTEDEFAKEKEISQMLVSLLTPRYGSHSLADFGANTYKDEIGSIFFDYHRSFLAIDALVTRLGSVMEIFQAYHRWSKEKTDSLVDWFEV